MNKWADRLGKRIPRSDLHTHAHDITRDVRELEIS